MPAITRQLTGLMTIGMALLAAGSCSAPGPTDRVVARTQAFDRVAEPAAPVSWQIVQAEQLDDAGRAQIDRGLAVQRAMAGQLKAALMQAVDEGGPEAAIGVCHEQAPRIAAELATSEGVAIGRTSMRLRNPDNQPPEWARTLVAAQVAEPTWLVAPDGRLAGLLPIRLQPECEICHGDPGAMAEEVRARIAEHYPEDRALGFAAGDLRGWFWVEVPAEQAPDKASTTP